MKIWPTRAGLRILRVEDGRHVDVDLVSLRYIAPGNLALGPDCLAVFLPDEDPAR